MEAQVVVAGNVGARVDWREVGPAGGRAVFSLACSPRVRRNGEWVKGPTTWYRVTCWRWLAENVRDSVEKGDPVVVGGRLTTQRWEGADGHQREDFEIEAEWVAPDLRRGTSRFSRSQPRPVADEPQFESDRAAERAEQVTPWADAAPEGEEPAWADAPDPEGVGRVSAA